MKNTFTDVCQPCPCRLSADEVLQWSQSLEKLLANRGKERGATDRVGSAQQANRLKGVIQIRVVDRRACGELYSSFCVAQVVSASCASLPCKDRLALGAATDQSAKPVTGFQGWIGIGAKL